MPREPRSRHPAHVGAVIDPVRAVFGGQTVVDTTRAMILHETGLLPQLYVPLDDIRAELIRPTDHHTYCPFKGTASYWTVTAGGQVAENAIWAYPEPNEESGWLDGYAGFYWNAMDEWYDEDERVDRTAGGDPAPSVQFVRNPERVERRPPAFVTRLTPGCRPIVRPARSRSD